MNKRALHHTLVVLRQVKFWQLVLALIVLTFLSAYFLRQNNLHMITLRNLVKQADEQNKDIDKALINLRDYVAHHMNTSLGDKGIYLDKSYQRAYDQAVQAAEKNASPGSAVYQQADKECQSLFSRTASFPAYIQCVTDKVGASGAAQDPLAAIKAPPVDLFRYNFVSPVWSPDVAGFTVLATLLLSVIVAGRTVLMVAILGLLKWRQR